MILYRPTDGDAHTTKIEYRPRTCFVMTQLGQPVPKIIEELRTSLAQVLQKHDIHVIDANSVVTGRDFLIKIWRLLLGVPLGVAIIHADMSPQTFSNIFYEVGMMQAYGKETLIMKSKGTKVPSDFVRTEYLEFSSDFEERLGKFANSFFDLADYYETVANQLENNPLLAIDYLRRAYLISGDDRLRQKARKVFDGANLEGRAKNSVEMLLVDF